MYFDNRDAFLQPQVTQHGSHMVMTNVHKDKRVMHWNIDTRFRDDYDSYALTTSGGLVQSYTFTLPQPINDVRSISVNNAEIPISFYNISAAMGNNVMKVGTTLVTVPDGFYTSTTLRTALNGVLSGLTFDISSNSNPYTSFKNTTGSPITISFAVTPSNTCSTVTKAGAGTPAADFDKYNVKSKLGWLLGFRSITYTIASGVTLGSESLLDLTAPRYLYLVVDEFTNSNTNSFISPLPTSIINKNILAKITIDYAHYSFGQVITANPPNGLLVSDRRCYNGKVNLQKLKIQLVNAYGAPIHLNGLDFSFCLEVEYE
jgi:hypothetical protein